MTQPNGRGTPAYDQGRTAVNSGETAITVDGTNGDNEDANDGDDEYYDEETIVVDTSPLKATISSSSNPGNDEHIHPSPAPPPSASISTHKHDENDPLFNIHDPEQENDTDDSDLSPAQSKEPISGNKPIGLRSFANMVLARARELDEGEDLRPSHVLRKERQEKTERERKERRALREAEKEKGGVDDGSAGVDEDTGRRGSKGKKKGKGKAKEIDYDDDEDESQLSVSFSFFYVFPVPTYLTPFFLFLLFHAILSHLHNQLFIYNQTIVSTRDKIQY
jgi:hypothetical protein